MGNVHASTAPPPPPPGVSYQKDTCQETPEDKIENPGPLEEIHQKCKNVFPSCFDGARVMLSRGLSNHFQVSHTLNMSSMTPSGYRFGATYVGNQQISPTEAFPVLLGDIDPLGNMNANFVHLFTPNILGKFVTQVKNSKFLMSQFTVNYKGSDHTSSLTLVNPDIITNRGVFVFQYLQAVTSRFALGAELVYQRSLGDHGAMLSAAARYSTDLHQFSATASLSNIHLSYYQKASKQLQVGVELEMRPDGESVTTIGYQVDLPKSDVVFRGQVDSNLTVGALLEKKLNPLPFTLSLSTILNHQKDHFTVGVGLILG